MQPAKVWTEIVLIPTYGTGEPDKNPMFLEKRVYQGSSGKVYPYPVVDKILDEKEEKPYRAVFLENEYLKIMVLPELGGRIQRAYDKTNGYDFVYYNEVIKPALVGLLGPWISGGIEFNWPQHHRPTTFAPVDFRIREDADGSAAVELSETDQMYGTKALMTVTLRPGKAYIEIGGQLYNPTPLPQTFLWWANPAVAVNDRTYSVFPPDVHAVFDHGKRDVSAFPIARGVYYKHDYSAGVDISRYKNIPVPTSYMCAHSDADFVGGYDEGIGAGILHVADHHVSPGKKQWTWGCGDFGRAWDRNLTDANGPYIELMTGMYCDNQPDFTWLLPHEEKTFTQYFMPYKGCGRVKNASRDCVVNLEKEGDQAKISVYVTARQENARVLLTADGKPLYDQTVSLSPESAFSASVGTDASETALTLTVLDGHGRKLLSYTPAEAGDETVPDPMPPARQPEEIETNEELYLTGLHLEQYRHATFLPDPYYLEALRRDGGDIRANNAYGLLLLRQGCFAESEPFFRAAIARMTQRNPNPYDSEAYLNLGLSLFFQGREDEAYDAFYKAAWSAPQQEAAYYFLACIACRRKDYETALIHVERGLARNIRSLRARALKGLILQSLGRMDEAKAWLQENLRVDAFDYPSRLALGDTEGALCLMGSRPSSFIECAVFFAEAGYFAQAVRVLDLCPAPNAIVLYHKALYLDCQGLDDGSALAAAQANDALVFPNRLEDIAVLRHAMKKNTGDGQAPYLLGCLWYDKRQYDRAAACWGQSAALDPAFPAVRRCLAIYAWNRQGDAAAAIRRMEEAYALNEGDARVLLELDQLYKKTGRSVEERLEFLTKHFDTVSRRDDLFAEYCALLSDRGEYEKALSLLAGRRFHPWEGGEGKPSGQYAYALTALGREALEKGSPAAAIDLLQKALVFPENLGEGKLEGAKDNNIHYFLGLAYRALGDEAAAAGHFRLACLGEREPAGMLYYNDQPADMIFYQGLAHRAMGEEEAAKERFRSLLNYGQKHLSDEVRMDYFAVSLPDLSVFDEDLNRRNRVFCLYLTALGKMGLGDEQGGEEALQAALALDPAHQGALFAERRGSCDRH